MAVTRSKNKVWVLGGTLDCLSAVKLPSSGEVLKVLFDFYREKTLVLKTSINKTVIWVRAQMPTRHQNFVKKFGVDIVLSRKEERGRERL